MEPGVMVQPPETVPGKHKKTTLWPPHLLQCGQRVLVIERRAEILTMHYRKMGSAPGIEQGRIQFHLVHEQELLAGRNVWSQRGHEALGLVLPLIFGKVNAALEEPPQHRKARSAGNELLSEGATTSAGTAAKVPPAI